jgi:DNA-binding MarR family transcriptional regulator
MHMLTANKLGVLGVLLSDTMAAALGGLSPSAAALLLTLRYQGEVTATRLATIAGIAQPTAVRVTGGLIRRKLVERRDRAGRTTPLRLTRDGVRRAEALQRARLNAMNRVLASLTARERAAFEAALDKMLAGATRSPAFARTVCRLCDHDLCRGPLCPIGSRVAAIERAQAVSEEETS